MATDSQVMSFFRHTKILKKIRGQKKITGPIEPVGRQEIAPQQQGLEAPRGTFG